MKNQAVIFLLAVQFLTRIPISTDQLYTPERLEASTRYYPLVGLFIGGVCALTYWASQFVFPNLIAVIFAIAAGLILSGGFHEDGLADTFDGIGGGLDRDQALEIMKDSRLGTYGTLALIIALGVKFSALIALPALWIIAGLIAAHTMSRLSSIIVITTSTYAREDGKAKPVASGISRTGLGVAALTGLVTLCAVSWVLPLTAILAGAIGLVVGHIGMRFFFERKLGGYTGDTLGAIQQVSEIGFYLGLVAWLS